MSENRDNRNFLNPSLVNEGWSKMKNILDQEMPSRQKRFAGWIWIFTGLIISIGATLFIKGFPISRINDTLQESPLALESLSRIQGINSDTISSLSSNNQLTSGELANEFKTSESNQGNSKDQKIDPSGREQKSNLKLGKIEVTKPLRFSDFPATSKKLDRSKKMGASALQDNQAGETQIKKKEMTYAPQSEPFLEMSAVDLTSRPSDNHRIIERLSVINFYPSISSSSITIPVFSISSPGEEVIKQEIQRKFDFIIGGGGISDMDFSHVGWEVTGKFRYPMSRYMSIGIGVGYWQMNANTSFNAISQNTTFSNAVTLRDMSSSPNQLRDSSLFAHATNTIQAGKLKYFMLPVFVQFFPNNKWQPRVGFSKFFYAKSVPGQADLEAADPGHIPIAQVDTEAIERDLLRKANSSLDVGLSYQAGKKLLIDIGVRWGFKSYLNYSVDGDFKNLHRHYTLNVLYKF